MNNHLNSHIQFQAAKVNLSCIDTEDFTYRITTSCEIERLICSIQDMGLLSPPVLKAKNRNSETVSDISEEQWMIVSGFRRIKACQKLGWSHIDARILIVDTQALDCVKLAIIENAFQRPLNLIENSRAIQMLSKFFKNKHELTDMCSVLGLPYNFSMIQKIEKLACLPEPLQNSVLSEILSLSMALELKKFEPILGIAFTELFEQLKLSLNKQREILTLIKEIAIRDDCSMMDVFQAKDFQDILNHKDIDRNQKTREIRFYLKQRRYPHIVHAEQAFQCHLKELQLGNHIQLIPPPHFEGTIYTLNLCFQNLEELKAHQARLNRLLQNPSFKKILD